MKRRRDKGQRKPQLKALWQALDEAAFGAERTLNLRESLPTAAEARQRTESWLRARQVTRTEEVLIITGRGNQSAGGVGVVRQEILAMLPSLRRRGVVESWREHSPGSLVVKLAPLSVLMGAGRRRRDTASSAPVQQAGSISGLTPETHRILRQLALHNLNQLGVNASDQFVGDEMARIFSTLLVSVGDVPDREVALRTAISNALDE
jgi:hypothetical protein